MSKKLPICYLIFFSLFLSVPEMVHAQSYHRYEVNEFQTDKGDYLFADLRENVGYLMNEVTQTYTSFPILSGQRHYVRYIGRSYFAGTPEKTWFVKAKNILGNRVMFGPSGEFLRFYDNDERTAYGIHGHKYFQMMLDEGNRYRSYGCIIVADDVLDVIEKSFLANGNQLKVVTVFPREGMIGSDVWME